MASLKIKKFQEIFNSLVTWISTDNSNLSDFNVGSALRTLTESVSLQVEELYFNMRQNVEYAISTAIYSAFGFEAVKSEYASTYVTFSFVEPTQSTIIIPTGFTVCTSLNNSKIVYYRTTANFTVPAGSTNCMVGVTCTEPGEIGNCEVGEINTLVTVNGAIDEVTNTMRVVNGVEQESVADMKMRFREYIKSLGRATRESIEYGIKTVDGVAGVKIDDNYIGFVNAYVHDHNGELPDTLVGNITETLIDYRAAGIEVKILPCVKHPIDLDSVTLIARDEENISTMMESINNLVKTYLNNYTVGKNFYLSDLITLIMKNYRSVLVTIDTGTLANVNILYNEVIVAGNVDLKFAKVSEWG